MTKRMLIDGTHPEEIRVVVTDGKRLDEYDVETSTKKQLKGNIYLAKVTRVEPSLQAAFIDYGGNRHGFLAFNEIHPDYYQIPISDREARAILQQVVEGAEHPRPKYTFAPGEVVRVTDGPFQEFNGTVEDVNFEKSKLRVAVTIFGRSTPVELSFSQVEKG